MAITQRFQDLALGDNREYSKFMMQITPEEAIHLPKLVNIQFDDKYDILEVLLKKLMVGYKCKTLDTADEIDAAIMALMESRKFWSLEDFAICFKRAKEGKYNQAIGGMFSKLDIETIDQFCCAYEQERCDVLEKYHRQQAHKPTESEVQLAGVFLNRTAGTEVNTPKGSIETSVFRLGGDAYKDAGAVNDEIAKYFTSGKPNTWFTAGKVNQIFLFLESVKVINLTDEQKWKLFREYQPKAESYEAAVYMCRRHVLTEFLQSVEQQNVLQVIMSPVLKRTNAAIAKATSDLKKQSTLANLRKRLLNFQIENDRKPIIRPNADENYFKLNF